MDDFLRCDEVWDMSPMIASGSSPNCNNDDVVVTDNLIGSIRSITEEDFHHFFATNLRKEAKYMVRSEYIKLLQSDHFVANCRLKAIHWFIYQQRRFSFGMGTVFNAVNYLDRFIEMNNCRLWNYPTMELLFLCSLSIATKFVESCPPSLHQIQEGLENYFEAKLIQKMEFKVLKSLGWELNSVTPYSYIELFGWKLNQDSKFFLRSRLEEVFVASSLDAKLLEYRPCVIAMSGFRYILEEQDYLSHIYSLIPVDQQEHMQSCYKILQESLVRYWKSESKYNSSSPDTVLLSKELQVAIDEQHMDLSCIDEQQPARKDKRRKRVDDDEEEGGESVNKYKKYVK